MYSRNKGTSVGHKAELKTARIAISCSVPDFISASSLFLFSPFSLEARVASSIVDALTVEREELSSRCNDLKRKLRDAGKEASLAQTEKTELAERIKKLELENRCLRADMESLQRMVEDASNTGADQKRRKIGYMFSTLDVKFVGSAAKLLASVPKYCSRENSTLGPFSDED